VSTDVCVASALKCFEYNEKVMSFFVMHIINSSPIVSVVWFF